MLPPGRPIPPSLDSVSSELQEVLAAADYVVWCDTKFPRGPPDPH